MLAPSHLKSLQALEMAARTGSFTLAADRLGITPAAVGQRVKVLEDYLGIALLVRGRAGVRAAPELEAALAHLARGFAAIEAASDELELQRGQELHIAAASDFADLWLAPRLTSFRAAHPHIRFCINGEGDAPMRLGRVDCEIRFGGVEESDETDLLFRDFVLPVTSPANRERTATEGAQTSLEGFPLLHLDFYKDDPAGLSWPDWIRAAGVERSAPERGMRFQRIAAVLDAVRAHAGVTLCGLALLEEALETGEIALSYPARTGRWSRHAFAARYRADSARRPHVQRFRTWLVQESRRTQDWLARIAAERA